MKKLILSALALAAVVLSASAADVAVGTGSATLQAAVAVETTGGTTGFTGGESVADGLLQFGTIAVGTTSSVIAISPTTGARSLESGNSVLNGGTTSAAAFKVTGANIAYTITIPTTAVVLTRTSGTETINVTGFDTNVASETQSNVAGVSYFMVGANLTIPGNQLAGAYTGTFNVSVDYN